jgi:MFS family permease
VKNFGGLLATRFLLGVFEAGFFPGAIWIVSQWYPPHKTQSRMAMFYLSSALSGAFSGLLAAGIAQMRGVGGYEGWRWIFLLEGILSVVVGVSCFFLLPDSPGTARWLKPDEARFLELMHISSRGAKTTHDGEKDKKHHWKTLWRVLCDKQLYLQALVFASNSVPNYGLKFTMPQVCILMCIVAFAIADKSVTDHPQHGLHVNASPAPNRTALHLRRYRSGT